MLEREAEIDLKTIHRNQRDELNDFVRKARKVSLLFITLVSFPFNILSEGMLLVLCYTGNNKQQACMLHTISEAVITSYYMLYSNPFGRLMVQQASKHCSRAHIRANQSQTRTVLTRRQFRFTLRPMSRRQACDCEARACALIRCLELDGVMHVRSRTIRSPCNNFSKIFFVHTSAVFSLWQKIALCVVFFLFLSHKYTHTHTHTHTHTSTNTCPRSFSPSASPSLYLCALHHSQQNPFHSEPTLLLEHLLTC